ncbi:MAG: SusD/RagB family nutrient-binding outer membrane lipoprotein [Chitinophagaceae bacterium]|nr:SusD/RagB family nutrient-binding outer membrane lipoprotein [Chitinophagaceae bacterium]
MKNIKYLLVIVTALAFAGSGCEKTIDDAYANPNAPVKVPPETLLPQIISTLAANYAGHGPLSDIRFIGRYTQDFTVTGALDNWDRMGGPGNAGIGNTDLSGSIWRTHYYDMGQNVNRMMEWATEEQKWHFVGIGKALFAWSWLQLTDYHGPVILKEAFNTNLLTFNFDDEELVYEHVRKLCHEALFEFNRTDGNVSQSVIAEADKYFYGGDVNKWKKFVYAVLARSFHHLTNKSNYNADSVIRYADLAITQNADNATVKFANVGIGSDANFFGPLRGNIGTYRQTAFIANLMDGRNPAFQDVKDPRIHYMLQKNPNGTYLGLEMTFGNAGQATTNNRPNGLWGQRWDSTVARDDLRAKFFFKNGAEVPVITAAEVLFMKAEAAFRKGDRATARTAYRDAISRSMDMLTLKYEAGIPDAEKMTPTVKANFLADPKVVPTVEGLTLTHIMLQKYIALWAWGTMENWVDIRRYHYTDLDPATGEQVYRSFAIPEPSRLHPDNGGLPVYRVRYRFNAEYVWNAENLRKMGAFDLNYHTREVWFSKP